jgi:hypothetical protein
MTIARCDRARRVRARAGPACFHPNYENVACGPGDTCPGGMTCNLTSGLCEHPGDGPIADAAVSDGAPGSDGLPVDARQCFGVGLLKNLCLSSAPAGDVTMSSPINTDTAGACTQVFPQTGSPSNAPELCAIAGKAITVQGTVTVTGSRARRSPPCR